MTHPERSPGQVGHAGHPVPGSSAISLSIRMLRWRSHLHRAASPTAASVIEELRGTQCQRPHVRRPSEDVSCGRFGRALTINLGDQRGITRKTGADSTDKTCSSRAPTTAGKTTRTLRPRLAAELSQSHGWFICARIFLRDQLDDMSELAPADGLLLEWSGARVHSALMSGATGVT